MLLSWGFGCWVRLVFGPCELLMLVEIRHVAMWRGGRERVARRRGGGEGGGWVGGRRGEARRGEARRVGLERSFLREFGTGLGLGFGDWMGKDYCTLQTSE